MLGCGLLATIPRRKMSALWVYRTSFEALLSMVTFPDHMPELQNSSILSTVGVFCRGFGLYHLTFSNQRLSKYVGIQKKCFICAVAFFLTT